MRSQYARWDGRQDPLAPRGDVGATLDRIADDLLMGSGGRDAVRRLQQRGMPGQRGLHDLRRALSRQRRELHRQIDGQDPLADLAEALDEVVDLERAALAGRDDQDARFGELDLDTLPPDPAGRFRGLSQHDFASAEAEQRLTEIADQLRKDVLDAHLASLTGALEAVTDEDVRRIAAMLADLNRLLEARAANGGDPPPDEPERFAEFTASHGDLLPGEPADLDELMALMAERAAAAQRFLDSLSPQQRAQLRDLANQVFDDLDLEFQLDQLGGNLAAAYPTGIPVGEGEADDTPEPGGSPGPMSRLVEAHQRLAELDDLEEQLAGEYEGATLEDVDEDALRRNLGDDAVRDLAGLRAIERDLEASGAVRVRGGEFELTPRGTRLLGERSLARLMARVRREPAASTAGADPEPTGQTRAWQFGDRAPLAVRRSINNAVLREASARRAPAASGGVRLLPDDLEVEEQEVRPRTATALLLDLSFSMPLRGHFVPAKRMALALHALIEGRHRQDSLHLIGFSDYARRMQPADLTAAGFERVYGTNMQHAFLLARRLLVHDTRPIKRVIMVTDGEPTAHLVDGETVFNWPPIPETLEATLREAMRLARSNIELDVFLLEDEPGLIAFAERLADVTGGEVVRMDAESAGRRVVTSYGS